MNLRDDPAMDAECLAICEALNTIPGITTTSSCCGHGMDPFKIWFVAERLEDLPAALYYFDRCHSGRVGWSVEATTDCGMSSVTFVAVGPVGEQAYQDAEAIAGKIRAFVNGLVTSG
jgi:hypothetical protein